MLCHTRCTVAEMCVLALILLAERAVSQEDSADTPAGGDLSTRDPPATDTGLAPPEDADDPFPCPEGQHFEPHVGCTKGPRRYSVSYDLRVLAMALATVIGVGVPCLVFIGLCFLLANKIKEEGEEDEEDDVEAKGNTEDRKDAVISGDMVTFDVNDSQHKISVE